MTGPFASMTNRGGCPVDWQEQCCQVWSWRVRGSWHGRTPLLLITCPVVQARLTRKAASPSSLDHLGELPWRARPISTGAGGGELRMEKPWKLIQRRRASSGSSCTPSGVEAEAPDGPETPRPGCKHHKVMAAGSLVPVCGSQRPQCIVLASVRGWGAAPPWRPPRTAFVIPGLCSDLTKLIRRALGVRSQIQLLKKVEYYGII